MKTIPKYILIIFSLVLFINYSFQNPKVLLFFNLQLQQETLVYMIIFYLTSKMNMILKFEWYVGTGQAV